MCWQLPWRVHDQGVHSRWSKKNIVGAVGGANGHSASVRIAVSYGGCTGSRPAFGSKSDRCAEIQIWLSAMAVFRRNWRPTFWTDWIGGCEDVIGAAHWGCAAAGFGQLRQRWVRIQGSDWVWDWLVNCYIYDFMPYLGGLRWVFCLHALSNVVHVVVWFVQHL